VATGTDLDLTIRVEQEVIGIDDGSCVVPARLSADIRALPRAGCGDRRRGRGEDRDLRRRSHFGLRAFSVVEFPTMTEPEGTTVDLPGPGLAEGLRQVVRAAVERRRPDRCSTGVLHDQ